MSILPGNVIPVPGAAGDHGKYDAGYYVQVAPGTYVESCTITKEMVSGKQIRFLTSRNPRKLPRIYSGINKKAAGINTAAFLFRNV